MMVWRTSTCDVFGCKSGVTWTAHGIGLCQSHSFSFRHSDLRNNEPPEASIDHPNFSFNILFSSVKEWLKDINEKIKMESGTDSYNI